MTPRESVNEHRAVASLGPLGTNINLKEILCEKEERVVGQDWCVRWENQFLQISEEHEAMNLAGKSVIVTNQLDATLVIRSGGVKLNWTLLTHRPAMQRPRVKKQVVNNQKWKPSASHPWQQPFKKRAA